MSSRTRLALMLLALAATASPLALAHYYYGPFPPPCNDGRAHEHYGPTGQLACRSGPACNAEVQGARTRDPLTGADVFEGPVLVTVEIEPTEFTQVGEPQVATRGHGGLGALAEDNQATVLRIGVDKASNRATWLVVAGPDVQLYSVDFRVPFVSEWGEAECRREWTQRN